MRLRHLLIVMGLFVAAVLYLPIQMIALLYFGYGEMYFLFPFVLPTFLLSLLGGATQLPESWSGGFGLRLFILLTVLLTWLHFVLIWLVAKGCLRLLGSLYRRSRQTHSVAEHT